MLEKHNEKMELNRHIIDLKYQYRAALYTTLRFFVECPTPDLERIGTRFPFSAQAHRHQSPSCPPDALSDVCVGGVNVFDGRDSTKGRRHLI